MYCMCPLSATSLQAVVFLKDVVEGVAHRPPCDLMATGETYGSTFISIGKPDRLPGVSIPLPCVIVPTLPLAHQAKPPCFVLPLGPLSLDMAPGFRPGYPYFNFVNDLIYQVYVAKNRYMYN